MSTLDKASDYVHDAADNIIHAASYTTEALGEKGEQLLNAEQKLMKSCRNYVRANPLTLLTITLTAGFVLGRLCRGRC